MPGPASSSSSSTAAAVAAAQSRASGGGAVVAASGSNNVDSLSKALSRQLTHVQHEKRQETVEQLRAWLASRERHVGEAGIDPVELRKVWKALYYCFWLTDKRPVQHEMADQLSRLSSAFQREANVFAFFDAFFFVMRTEWCNIDYLRLDKYLYLIRRVWREWLAEVGPQRYRWSDDSVTHFVQSMAEVVVYSDKAPGAPDGLVCHLAMIFMTELQGVLSGGGDGSSSSSSSSSMTPDLIRRVLCPMYDVLVHPSTSDTVFNAVMRDVFDVFVHMCERGVARMQREREREEDVNGDDDRHAAEPAWLPPSLLPAVAEDLFDLAADKDAQLKSIRRKALYALSKRMKELVPPVVSVTATATAAAAHHHPLFGSSDEGMPSPIPRHRPSDLAAHSDKTLAEQVDDVLNGVDMKRARVGPNSLNESFMSESSVSSRKSVRFSHADVVGIPKITMKMKRTPAKPSCELGVPSKGVLKRTSTLVSPPAAPKFEVEHRDGEGDGAEEVVLVPIVSKAKRAPIASRTRGAVAKKARR